MKYCSGCGIQNEQTASFCQACGQPLRENPSIRRNRSLVFMVAVLVVAVIGFGFYSYLSNPGLFHPRGNNLGSTDGTTRDKGGTGVDINNEKVENGGSLQTPAVTTKPASGPGTVHRFENTPSALTELVNDSIDAVVAYSPVVLEYIKNNPQSNLRVFGDSSFDREFYGIAMRQADTDIHKLINEGLARISENGTYDLIFNKYFGDGADYQVKERGNHLGLTLNVALDMAYAPFEYINDDGEPEGFDVDLIRAIAAEMGFAVNLVNTNWDGIIPSLLAGTSDMIISAMTITEQRQQSVTFSDPYFKVTQYVAVKQDSPIKTLEDLQGKRVGVQNATSGDFNISDYFDSLK